MIRNSTCLILAVLLTMGCGRAPSNAGNSGYRTGSQTAKVKRQRRRATYGKEIELPQADQKPGTAIVLLVDTSGSMKAQVDDGSGNKQPKYEIAAKVMQQIADTTESYLEKNPVVHLEFGIFSFSSSVSECLKIGKFERQATQAGIGCVPPPNGGTAIGRAVVEGFKALHSTGCVRKYLVCVTDGENTSGPDPALIARQLFQQTQGDVEIHFVAFDVSSSKFRFLSDVNGFVVEAADGQQLSQRMNEIYEKRILAEAPAEEEIKQ